MSSIVSPENSPSQSDVAGDNPQISSLQADHDNAPYRVNQADDGVDATPNRRVRPNDSTAALEIRVAKVHESTGLGTRCAVTRQKLAVENAHVLAKKTKSGLLDTLEFSWALTYRTLNTNSRYNIIKLDATLHSISDSVLFILLPQESHIRDLLHLYGLENGAKPQKVNPITIYAEAAVYDYTIVGNQQMSDQLITRLDPLPANDAIPDRASTQTHLYPYHQFGSVSTTVRPYFIICNIGILLDPEGNDLGLEGIEDETFDFLGINLPFAERVIQCLKLWAHWRKSSPTKAFFATPPRGTSTTHRSNATSRRRAPSTTVAKRTRSGIPFTIQHEDVGSSPEEAPQRKKARPDKTREPSPSDRASRRG